MNYNLPGSSVHGILQVRILEWVAISFSGGSSQPGDQTQVSCIAGRFFTNWATREAQSERSISKKDISADKENIWDQRDHSNVLQTITCWVRCTSDPPEEKTSLYLFFLENKLIHSSIFKSELGKIRVIFSGLLKHHLPDIPVWQDIPLGVHTSEKQA